MQLSPTDATPSPLDASQLTLGDAYKHVQRELWSPYVGLLVNAALITVFLSEVVKYFRLFGRDRPIIKATIVALSMVEFTQCVFCFYAGYIVFAKQWGRNPVWNQMIYGNMIPDTCVASMTHALYAWRVYDLFSRPRRRNQWLGGVLAGAICVLSFIQLICCLLAVVWTAMPPQTTTPHQVSLGRTFFRIWLVACVAADAVITTSLLMRLKHCRSGQQSTDSFLSRAVWILIPGGLLTALATLATLIVELFSPGEDYYSFLLLCLSKLYGIAIVVCLNLRLQYEVRPNWLPEDLDTSTTVGEEAASVMSDSAERFGWLRSNNPCLAHSIAGAANGVVSVNRTATASNSNLLPMLRGSNSISAQTQIAQQQQGLVNPYHLPTPSGETSPNESCNSAATLLEPTLSPAALDEVAEMEGAVNPSVEEDVEKLKRGSSFSARSLDAKDKVLQHRRAKSLSTASAATHTTATAVPFPSRTSRSPSGIRPKPLLLVNTSQAALHRRHPSLEAAGSERNSHGSGNGSGSDCAAAPNKSFYPSPTSSASSYRSQTPTASPSTPVPQTPPLRLPYISPHSRASTPPPFSAASLTFTPIEVMMSPCSDAGSQSSKRNKRHGRIFECVQNPDPNSEDDTESQAPSRHTFGRRGHGTRSHHEQQLSLTSTTESNHSHTRSDSSQVDFEEADVTTQNGPLAQEASQMPPLGLLAATAFCQSNDIANVDHANSLGYCNMFAAALPARPPRRTTLQRRSGCRNLDKHL